MKIEIWKFTFPISDWKKIETLPLFISRKFPNFSKSTDTSSKETDIDSIACITEDPLFQSMTYAICTIFKEQSREFQKTKYTTFYPFNFPFMKTISFAELVRNVDMNLANSLFNHCFELFELVSNWIFEGESEESDMSEICQYYIISPNSAEYVSRVSGLPLFYSEELDVYVLGVTFLWMSWEDIAYSIED